MNVSSFKEEVEDEEESMSCDYESLSTWPSSEHIDSYEESPFAYDPYESYDWES